MLTRNPAAIQEHFDVLGIKNIYGVLRFFLLNSFQSGLYCIFSLTLDRNHFITGITTAIFSKIVILDVRENESNDERNEEGSKEGSGQEESAC